LPFPLLPTGISGSISDHCSFVKSIGTSSSVSGVPPKLFTSLAKVQNCF
jgi:hypothetical protein